MLSFRIPSLGSHHHPSTFAEKVTDDPKAAFHLKTAAAAAAASQSTVTCGYQAHIAGYFRNVTVLWSKNVMHHSLTLMVSSLDNDMNYCCKIDLVKPWQFWSKKGSKSFTVEGNLVEIFWDLRSAKLSGNGCPEPVSDYYIAVVSDEEVVLLLGDLKKKAYKRTKSRPALVDPFMCYKKESVFSKKTFSTRASFDERRKEHEVVVESSCSGGGDGDDGGDEAAEMWIRVDGVVVVHVRNLQWKFRGNQTVLVDKTAVQVYYDVHDWLFGSQGMAANGLFVFKPVTVAIAAVAAEEEGRDTEEAVAGGDSGGGGGSSPVSRYYSASSGGSGYGPLQDFCLFLYAWKLE
ncbi:PREDICTED: uncharacterized protein LOC104822443 [Tarenaya hassleriana]|uniref:uncharacterized protein LOC104822443 n=1 Tax=Tarenaya hassleriana TaxID=28532 RepID=UPI00053C0EDA|nr:PREDICTED: uncharacterized protein LOC104822443 [Tarenaya hassleriana]